MSRKYYKNQTELALDNFCKGKLTRDFIRAFAEVKKACIVSTQETKHKFENKIYNAVIAAIDSIIVGDHDKQFVVPFMQGSAGTSINMNFNEVIAGLAEEILSNEVKIDPIEDINIYQSTNDVLPTAFTVMAYRHLLDIEGQIINLQELMTIKENEYTDIMITGRTEMQAALPITLGQVFGAWAGAIERDRWRLNKLKERIRTIALGGTAIGTCFNAPKEYVFAAEKHLRDITGLPLSRSQNLPDEISNTDKYAELASGYNLITQNLFKITGDLLIYTSTFVKEIEQPILQYGSSIMPAKTNPVILEYVRGLSIETQGECSKIFLFSQNGQLQLNSYTPFMIHCFINIHENIIEAVDALCEKFIKKIKVNQNNIERNLVKSYVLLNSLLPVLGYNKIKEIYLLMEDHRPCDMNEFKKILLDNTGINEDKLKEYFDPINATTFLKDEI